MKLAEIIAKSKFISEDRYYSISDEQRKIIKKIFYTELKFGKYKGMTMSMMTIGYARWILENFDDNNYIKKILMQIREVLPYVFQNAYEDFTLSYVFSDYCYKD
jgi:hypothetical protein